MAVSPLRPKIQVCDHCFVPELGLAALSKPPYYSISDGTCSSIGQGDHNICVHSNITGGWLSTQHIKMYLDINVGSAKHDIQSVPSHLFFHMKNPLGQRRLFNRAGKKKSLNVSAFRGDLSHVTTLATKLRELNIKVADIQREQRYMREVEATFRDASELTNTRAVWWSVGQIAVLIAAAIWQMRYLKVGHSVIKDRLSLLG